MDIPSVDLKVFSMFLVSFAVLCMGLAVALPTASVHLCVLAVITFVLALVIHSINL